MRVLLALALLAAPATAFAQAGAPASPQIMQDVKSGNWNDAEALAAATGDPLMEKIVSYFQLTNPGGGTADELQDFIGQNPDWPQPALMQLRLEQANGTYAGTVPPETPDFLTQVEALHDQGQDQQAAQLWASQGNAASEATTPDAQALFWPDQDELARALLGAGDAKDALAVVVAATPPTETAAARSQISDRDFLAGFILLRFLNQPAQAAVWFHDLAAASTAVITQARAYYWLARSETGAAATADYQRAAAYPDTFYGQLAAVALGDTPQALAARILAVPEPPTSTTDLLDFALRELPRAAALLVQMQDPSDAQLFLNRLGAVAPDDRTRELAAKLALGLSLPQSAVSIARSAGINGQMLVREGWPMPYQPPDTTEPALAYGIMRQESSFDPTAISGAGAMGLMQLMPETARRTAQQNGLSADDLDDPDANMALGTAYIAGLVSSFGNCLPLAIAAYNAGPTNVANWLAQNGDPEMGSTPPSGANIVDWIEEIPFAETRNYVQRVTESVVIYRALLHGTAEDPLSPWMKPS